MDKLRETEDIQKKLYDRNETKISARSYCNLSPLFKYKKQKENKTVQIWKKQTIDKNI